MQRAPLLAFLMLAASVGCAADQPSAASDTDGSESDDDDDDDDSTDPSASATDPSGGSTGSSGAEETGGSSDPGTDSGEPVPPPPARGIQIVDVTADQAVRIPIALDGELVDGPQRNAPILRGRPLVLRAFYELDPEFEPRDIYATLYIEQADGTVTEHANYVTAIHKECEGESRIDCRYGTLPNSFYWRLPAEEVRPGATYRIELLETAPGHENDASDKVPHFPVDGGSLTIGIEDSYMKMRVVLVPVDHDLGSSCPEPPDLDEDFGPGIDGQDRTVADFFGERLAAANPTDEVEIVVHDVVRYTGSLTGSQLLSSLQNLRFQEDYPPEYFYYAVARPCDDGPDFAGVAQIGGPTPGDAAYRVGWGVYYSNVGTTADTFVHEIGHEQGRGHIHCSGEEAGTDPSYPDPDGDLLNFGIDVFGTQVKVFKPSDHDYMTYCTSTWVSEWGYLKVLPWIEEMSSWELGDAGAPTQRLLVGNLRADGTEDWYVTEGVMPVANVSSSHTVRFGHDGIVTDVQSAAWVQWERSADVNVIVPAPVDFEAVTDLAWTDARGIAHAIDRTAVRRAADIGELAAPQ